VDLWYYIFGRRWTHALYRRCLRLVDLLTRGNNCNKRDFAEREANKLGNQLPSSPKDDCPPVKGRRRRVSMPLPVDRENKLQ
jgi:hypothetical protein